jgi:hypothetical protein
LAGRTALSGAPTDGGNYTVLASFPGSADYSAASALANFTVNQAATATTLQSAPASTAVFGQAVTFTATVAAVAPGTPTPTGSVSFLDGFTVLARVILSGGSASWTTTKLAVAGHSIIAIFAGTVNFKASPSAPSAVTVSQDATTAVVNSSVSNPVYGQAVTLKATVTAAAPGSGKPTGNVSFYDGPTFLGTATLSKGVASLQPTALAVGGHAITVVYGGDSNFLGTTSAVRSLTVRQDHTTTTLTASSATAVHGTPVTFTATVLPVTPGSGTPTGTVSFWAGSKLLGTVNLSGGVAQLTHSFSVIGTHKIKAVYNGDADFVLSTSAVLTETIT